MSNMIAEKFVCLLCVEKGAAQQLKALPKEQINEHVLNHMEDSEKLLLASSRCTNCHLFFETRASKVVHEESGHKIELIDGPGNREEELKAIRKRKDLIARKTRVIIVEQDIPGQMEENDVAETSKEVEEELQEVHEEQQKKEAEEAEEQQEEDVEEVEEFPVDDRLHEEEEEEEDQQEGLEEMGTPEDDQPPQLEPEGEVDQKIEEDSESNEDEEEDEDSRQTPLDALELHKLERANEREAQERKEKRRKEREQGRLQQPDGMVHSPNSEQLERLDEILTHKKERRREKDYARFHSRGAPKTPVVPPLPKKSGGTGVIRERPKIPMTLGTPRTPIRFREPPSMPVRQDSEESLPSTVESQGRQEEDQQKVDEEVEVLKKEEELGSEGTIENPVESGDVEAVDEKKKEEDEEVEEVHPEGQAGPLKPRESRKSTTPLQRYSVIGAETSEGQGPSSHPHFTRSHGRPIPMGRPMTERSLRMAMAASSSSTSSTSRSDIRLMGPPRTERSLRMAMVSSSSSSSRPDTSSAPSSSSSSHRQAKKLVKRQRREELRESLSEFEAALRNKEDLRKKKKQH